MQLLSILRMASGASLWRGLDNVEQGRVKNLRPDGKGAFDAEVEEFCLALLTGTYPADFTPEDGAAESEASAE